MRIGCGFKSGYYVDSPSALMVHEGRKGREKKDDAQVDSDTLLCLKLWGQVLKLY